MKTKHLRICKSTVSIVLSCIMLLSSVFTGSSETVITPDEPEQAAVETLNESALQEFEQADAEIDTDVVESATTQEDITVSAKADKKLPEKSGTIYNDFFEAGEVFYFIDKNSWGSVNAETDWTNGKNKNQFAMTLVDGTTNLYYATTPTGGFNTVIFYKNWDEAKNRTVKMTAYDNSNQDKRVFYSVGDKNSNNNRYCYLTSFSNLGISDSSSITGSNHTIGSSTKTIYFDKSNSGWGSNIYAHQWFSSSISGVNISFTTWPGSIMTLVSGTKYSVSVPTLTNGIVFNDNSSQTDDLTIPNSNDTYTYGSGWSSSTATEENPLDHTWSLNNYKDYTGSNHVFTSSEYDSTSKTFTYDTNTTLAQMKANGTDSYFTIKKDTMVFHPTTAYNHKTNCYFDGTDAGYEVKLGTSGDITMSFKNVTDAAATSAGNKRVLLHLNVSSVSSPKFSYSLSTSDVSQTISTTDYTVYFANSNNWSNVGVYLFDGTTTPYAWPGTTELDYTIDSDTGLLKYEITTDCKSIIFTNGAGGTKGTTQTYDLVLRDNAVYTLADADQSNGTLYSDWTSNVTYGITGRFMKKSGNDTVYNYLSGKTWNTALNDDFLFTQVLGQTYYKFDTGCTVAQLSAIHSTANEPYYFMIGEKRGPLTVNYKSVNKKVALRQENCGEKFHVSTNTKLADGSSWFNDTNFTKGTVTLYFDPTTLQFWYGVTGGQEHDVEVLELDAAYKDVKVTAPSTAYETSTVTVKVTNIPAGKTVDTITVSGVDTVTETGIGTHEYEFKMPAQDVTVSVTFRDLDKFTVKSAKYGDSNNENTLTPASGTDTIITEEQAITFETKLNFKYDVTWSITKTDGGAAATLGTDYLTEDGSALDLKSTSITFYPKANLTVTANYGTIVTEYTSKNFTLYHNAFKVSQSSLTESMKATLYKNAKNEIFAYFPVGDGGISASNHYFTLKNTNWTPNFATKTKGEFTSELQKYDTSDTEIGSVLNNPGIEEQDGLEWVYLSAASSATSKVNGVFIYVGTVAANSGDNDSPYYYKTTYNDGTEKSVRYYKYDADWIPITPAPAVDTSKMAKVYAKDATIRDGGYERYTGIADTTFLYNEENATTDDFEQFSSHTSYDTAYVERNREIVISTTINADSSNSSNYYVKAFCINGESYGVISEKEAKALRSAAGSNKPVTYSTTYTITDNDPSAIEITPIYYWFSDASIADLTGFVTFRVDNYSGTVQSVWGNTIACHAYYEKGSETGSPKNALGGYPGQPMVKIGSSYYMQIPKYTNHLGNIKGITLNNYVWDDIHGDKLITVEGFNGLYATTHERASANAQTYDYDDFVAINDLTNVDSSKYKVDQIVFTFKYKTNNNNNGKFDGASMGNVPTSDTTTGTGWRNYSTANSNGDSAAWEVLTDSLNRPIDMFGNLITNTELDTVDEVKTAQSNDKNSVYYIVSDGYENYYTKNGAYGSQVHDSFLGEYGTKWYVYERSDNNGSASFAFKGALPPSVFIPSYDYNDGSSYLASGVKTAADNKFSSTITELKALTSKPVMITYESALYSAGRQNAAINKGIRCDGRWTYTVKATQIESRVKIAMYDSDDGNGNMTISDCTIDEFKTNSNVGSITGASVYFHDTIGVQDGVTYTEAINYNSEQSYNFVGSAKSTGVSRTDSTKSTVYAFVGWYKLEDDGSLTKISDQVDGSQLKDGSYTFIAMYKSAEQLAADSSSKKLVVSHKIYTNDIYSTLPTATRPTLERGSGTTKVSVTVSKDGWSYTYPASTSAITVSPVYLDGTYQIDINLTMNGNQFSDYKQTIKVDGTSFTNIQTTGETLSPNSTKTITYYPNDDNTEGHTLKVNSLFTGDSKLATLDYYTSFTLRTIDVTYHYYDRDMAANAAIDIADEATDLTVSVPYIKLGEEISSVISRGMSLSVVSDDSLTQMNTIRNILDKYYVWTTQEDAVYGITNLPNYRANNDGTVNYVDGQEVTLDGTTITIDVDKHFNSLGYNDTNSNTAGPWVFYTSTSGETKIKNNVTANTTVADVNNADKTVEVWAYNVPDIYNVTYVFPSQDITGITGAVTAKDTNMTSITCNSDNTNKMPTDIYYVDPSKAKGTDITGCSYLTSNFYGQRVGLEDTTNPNLNLPGTHIAHYGIQTGYTGETIYATDEIKNSDGTETYVFEGWYDLNTGAKITSNINYGYRITNTTTIVAGYMKVDGNKTKVNQQIGASATALRNDVYISDIKNSVKENEYDLVQHTRLNTQINVYNRDTTTIDKLAVVYVVYRIQGGNSAYTTKSSSALVTDVSSNVLAYLDGNRAENLKYITSDGSKKIAFMDGYVYSNGSAATSSENGRLDLNNKDRAIFTYDINTFYAQKNGARSLIVAYVAFHVKDGNWILGDNAIEYIEGTSDNSLSVKRTNETNSTLTTPSVEPSTASLETSVEPTSVKIPVVSGSAIIEDDDTVIFIESNEPVIITDDDLGIFYDAEFEDSID